MSEFEPDTRTLTSEEAEVLHDHLRRARRRASLIVIRGPQEGRMFSLDRPRTDIGRSQECEVRIDDPGVSRRHATIERRGDELVIVDLGSSNGTFLDGRKIAEEPLSDGSQLQLASIVLKVSYQDPVEEDYQRRIYKSVTRDGLTGAYNKEFFHDHLENSVARSARYDTPLSLVLFDIDHFKKLNDRFGHEAGDFVLREAISIVQETLRGEDVLARCGGEEFGLVLQQTGSDRARIAGERLRQALAQHEFVWRGEPLRVTVSVGVATRSPELATAADLFRGADRNLYEAKRSGRNRTVSASA